MTDLRVITSNGTDAVLKEAAVQAFADSLRGPLLRQRDAGYDEARRVWNGMIDRSPVLIARCAGVADVINSVNFARTHRLLVAVRGGGHNVAGNAICDGGLTIDLSGMQSIRVDPVQRTARAEVGATWGEFDRETQTFGLATPGGQISTTGLAGLTLGGGWGHLARRHGLVSDNLISADLVLADGSFLTVSNTQHPELFWGLRGGGGNFGVVTSLEYQLHPVGPVIGGLVAYPMDKAKEALCLFRDLTAHAPDELASDIVLITMPDGTPVVGMVVCYNGASEEASACCGRSRPSPRSSWIRSVRWPTHRRKGWWMTSIPRACKTIGSRAFWGKSATALSTPSFGFARPVRRQCATALSNTNWAAQ